MPYLDESWLDDPKHLERCDTQETLRSLATAGAQAREAIVIAREAGIHAVGFGERPRSVLVGALGGTAVVADALEMFATAGSPVPVFSRRDVPLPGWVGPLDLVVAVSLSGRAKGPLALAAEAARRGCALLTIGAEDSPLAEVSHRARGVHIGTGRGRASSRTSLWTLMVPVLMGAHELGLINVPTEHIESAARRLDEEAEVSRPSSEHFVNPSKLAALQLAGTVPMALADGPLSAVAARRAASMFARTARVPLTWGELPDDASTLVATFDGPFTAGGGHGAGGSNPDDIFADPFLDAPSMPGLGLMTLFSHGEGQGGDLENVAQGVQETARSAGASVVDVRPHEDVPLARLAQLMQRIDYIATYLALGFGVDPARSRHVAELRDRLGDDGHRQH